MLTTVTRKLSVSLCVFRAPLLGDTPVSGDVTDEAREASLRGGACNEILEKVRLLVARSTHWAEVDRILE
jgi:hypothetical protein